MAVLPEFICSCPDPVKYRVTPVPVKVELLFTLTPPSMMYVPGFSVTVVPELRLKPEQNVPGFRVVEPEPFTVWDVQLAGVGAVR